MNVFVNVFDCSGGKFVFWVFIASTGGLVSAEGAVEVLPENHVRIVKMALLFARSRIITSPPACPGQFLSADCPSAHRLIGHRRPVLNKRKPPCRRSRDCLALVVREINHHVCLGNKWFGRPPACGMSATSRSHVSFICGSSTRTCQRQIP